MMRYREDLYPVSLILTGLLLSLLPFFIDSYFVVALAVVGVLMRALVPVHQHYHAHLATFKNTSLNALYDAALSVAGGNLTALWKVHHGLGHHVDYLDQHHDVEGNLRFGENIPCRRLVFTILGDALSLYDSFRLLKRFSPVVRRQHGSAILRQLSLQIGFFALLATISLPLTFAIFVLPNMILRWSIFWFSYGQHDNLPMTSVYNSSTTKFKLNGLLLNVGLHTAHHEKPGLHWSRLAARTEQILPLIDPACLDQKTIVMPAKEA